MKKNVKKNCQMRLISRWLIYAFIGMGMSISLNAAQSLSTAMTVVLGTTTGTLGDISLESDSKVIKMNPDSLGQARIKLKFPTSNLSSQIDIGANIQLHNVNDNLNFDALDTSGKWIRLGTITGETSYKKVLFNIPSGVIRNGYINIRLNSMLSTGSYLNLDQIILVDRIVTPPPSPTISFFSATPEIINMGQSSTLSFSISSNATSAIINPGSINVLGLTKIEVTPSLSTNYTLVASNASGSASASVGVTVNTVSGGLKITAGTKWYWQLQGTLNTSLSSKVYDIDLYDTSVSIISSLKSSGHIVICYFSAGTYENWRSDASDFPSSALGNNVDGWHGEKWLDVRNAEVKTIMAARMDLAKSKGCDGLEPDNVDGYSNNSGFPLKKQDQIDFNNYLATQAHARGLVVALKNSTDLVTSLVNSFDFAVVEECFKYNECSAYSPFINQNKAVLNAEYTSYSASTCTKAAGLNFSTAFFNLDLNGNKFQPCP